MERDLDPVPEALALDEIDHNPYLSSVRKISKNRSRRSLLFQRFLSFFCCNPSPKCSSMSRRSVGTVGPTPECPSPPSNGFFLGPSPQSFESSFPPQNSASQSYATADEASFDGTIPEQDSSSSSSQYPASDSIQSEDSTSQGYVTANRLGFAGRIPRQFMKTQQFLSPIRLTFPAQNSPPPRRPPSIGSPSTGNLAQRVASI